MRNIEEIIINRVFVSVLDRENNNVIFPEGELELTEEVYEYFDRHILKGLKDDEAKTAIFDGDRNIVKDLCKEIFDEPDNFIINSKKLSQYLHRCMNNDEKEVSGDVAVCQFETESGKYLAILKLNYSTAYCHYAKEVDGKPQITIGLNKTSLPGIGQKPSKSVFIQEIKADNEYDMLINDRQTEGYFTQAFIKCAFRRDRRENTKIIHKASENFARKAFKDNAHEAENFRNKLTEFLRSEDSFDVERVAEENIKDESLKKEYKAVMVSQGLGENKVSTDKEWAEKKLQKKRLKVDKAIELYIDVEAYNDKEKFQIKRNGDGTIDIILKNVRNYVEK